MRNGRNGRRERQKVRVRDAKTSTSNAVSGNPQRTPRSGNPSYGGYEYQVLVTIWAALDLILAKQATLEVHNDVLNLREVHCAILTQLDLRLGPAACLSCYPTLIVRPERRVSLAGGRPVRVSAGAPGSRLRTAEEIPTSERSVESLEEREQGSGPQHQVKAAASSEYQPKGDREGRAAHDTAKATDSFMGPECETGPPRGSGQRHVFKARCGTGETLPGNRVGCRPNA